MDGWISREEDGKRWMDAGEGFNRKTNTPAGRT